MFSDEFIRGCVERLVFGYVLGAVVLVIIGIVWFILYLGKNSPWNNGEDE